MAGQLGDALLGAPLLSVQRVARGDEAMQRRARLGLFFAQGRQFVRGQRLLARGCSLFQRALRDSACVLFKLALGLGQLFAGAAIMDQRGQRLVLTDLRGEHAIAPGLARLTAQAVGLTVDLFEHVLQPREIFRGGGQAKLRLVTA